MGRSATRNTQHLEQKNGTWWVTIAIPKALVDHFGKTRLKRNLGTDSLLIANRMKWAIVAELKSEIEEARGGSTQNPVLKEAMVLADARRRAHDDPDRFNDLEAVIALRAYEIAGKPIASETDEWSGEAVAIYDPAREREAKLFADVATEKATPFELHHEAFLEQQETTHRTKADDERAVAYLKEWCNRNKIPPTIQAITKRRAAQFMDDLPKSGEKRSPVTLNKYLRRLSIYWQWLIKRDLAETNVWQGMILKEPKKLRSEEERPFIADEMKALLKGPTTQELHDLMRIAALTGARLDAIVDLRVGDCADNVFTFKPQKAETDTRSIPIHSALAAIIARRVADKPPEADLFPEWPAPKKVGSQRERSFKTSNAFTAYRREVKVKDEQEGRRRSLVNFHSFRRWFITMAEQAGIPESTIASVVGHKRKGITLGTYSRGPSLEQLRACVEAVVLPEVGDVQVAQGRPTKVRGLRRLPPRTKRTLRPPDASQRG